MKIAFTTYFILLSFVGLRAQTYLLGDKVTPFALTDAVKNTNVSLNDFLQAKGVVVIFTNNSCPYSKLYESRLLSLASDFQTKDIRFVLINAQNSQHLEDQPSGMATQAKQNNYSFPYLIDSGGNISRQFGASKTPECFVLKNIKGAFVLFYKGAIDDNPQTAADVSNFYLKDALNSLLSNSPLKISEKRASGCMITAN